MSGFKEGLSSLDVSLSSGLSNIFNSLITLKDNFVSAITDLKDGFLDGLTSLGTFIVDGITKIFMPPEDLFEEKVNDLRSRFSFADSIISSASSLVSIISASACSEPEPPSIVMDINILGTVKAVTVIDMSWYAPFKRYGDMVMSGMIWVFFVWRIFVRLPGIIAGAEGVSDALSSLPSISVSRQSALESPKTLRLEDKSK